MVAALIPQPTPWWRTLAFNWFDVAMVLLLVFAYWRGRKRGMTKELLPFLQWLTILLGAGLGHIWLADWFTQQGVIKYCFGTQFKERTAALMSGYLAIALVIFVVFVALRRKYTPKLEGSSFFGSNEYYWGIPACMARYVCLILVTLALLNAPFYSAGEITAAKAYNNRWYGGGLNGYSGDFFPSVDQVQASVFKSSLLGPLIRDHLSALLIVPMQTAKKPGSH